MTTGTRTPGEFCWINVMTPDTSNARAFLGALLGWSFFDMPGMGHGITVGGRNVGGLFDVVSPQTPNGMPPTIGVMVKVDSADAVAERVQLLGGRAMAPFDIGTAGRMAVCHDPNGAQFDIWESKSMLGTDVDSTLPGAPSWFETLTSDTAKATAFYSALFGWTSDTMPMPTGNYTTFTLGDTRVAGLMELSTDMGARTPHWGTYFTVASVDETVRSAVALGGAVCVPATDIAGVGRFAGITSPQGVTFYVITYAS